MIYNMASKKIVTMSVSFFCSEQYACRQGWISLVKEGAVVRTIVWAVTMIVMGLASADAASIGPLDEFGPGQVSLSEGSVRGDPSLCNLFPHLPWCK